jgi:hypothetical protein
MSEGLGLISLLLGNAMSFLLASLGDSSQASESGYNLKRDY